MSQPKHLSYKEFCEFMHQRILKRIEQNPGKIPICIGAIVVPLDLPDSNSQLVECCRCRIPIYVEKEMFDLMQKYRLPWDSTKIPFFCQFCVPYDLQAGVFVQDAAAVLQHTGEK
jgi:hypothetical protein